jgi:chromosome segregation ATPase
MTINKNHYTQSGGIFSIFRRGLRWQKIDGYRLEDLNSEQPVWVTAGSTILGNIIAPQIKVSGMVNGSVVSQTVTITTQGELWGDAYTARLNIEPGGAIYGWLNSIDDSQYRLIQAEGSIPKNLIPDKSAASGSDAELDGQTAAHRATLDRLRHEAASAKTARAELEHTFEKRLSDVAGETAARVVTLSEQLADTRSELKIAQEMVATLESNLSSRQVQIAQQTEELATTRTLLEERSAALSSLQEEHDRQSSTYQQLVTSYKELDLNYLAAQQKIDELNKKIKSTESALQDNLQHSAEQEAALIRWQELAEDYQKQINGLENQLENNGFQIEEQSRVIEMLRERRDQLEADWKTAQEELELLRNRDTRLLTKEELQDERSLAEAYEATQVELARLQTAVTQLSHYEDKVMWYQLDLDTARAELQETRAVVGKQETRLATLQEELETAHATIEAKQQEIDQLNEYLEHQTNHARTLEQKLNEMQARIEEIETDDGADKTQNQLQLQLEAAEMELERHLSETATQGQHLAEIQATLVEREITIKQLKQTAVARAHTITEIKSAARKRIQLLEEKLATSQQKIEELQAFIERTHNEGIS